MLAVETGDPLLNWLVNNASAVGVLSFVIVALVRGWLVTGRELANAQKETAQTREERDRALDLVFKQAEIAGRALDTVEKVKG